ncbi:hypothetical protein D9M71_818560 [compost metagenome]
MLLWEVNSIEQKTRNSDTYRTAGFGYKRLGSINSSFLPLVGLDFKLFSCISQHCPDHAHDDDESTGVDEEEDAKQ